MNYQKVYMNQIYSSSLMGQVAQMWRNQLLCDAVIKTGNISTKAHRLVMIAACPMLQHMENAAVGSHLEVRMSADIKQESVITFLQYLYEGFMKLNEDNCRDVEKIGKLLHVDSVVKCCADFYKCMNSKTGAHSYDGAKFDSHDNTDFKHVRFTDLEKTMHESALKRSADLPPSPGGKRQRVSHPTSPSMGHRSDDRYSMSHSYSSQDTFDRIPRQATGSQYQTQGPTGVIEIAEDGVEVVSSDPPVRDAEGWPKESDLPPIQHSMGISVTGQITNETDLQIVNVEQAPQRRTSTNVPQPETGQRRIESPGSTNIGQRHQRQNHFSQDNMFTGQMPTRRGTSSDSPHQSPSDISAMQTFKSQFQSNTHTTKTVQSSQMKSTPISHSKPFAAGSASQTTPHPPPHPPPQAVPPQTSFVPETISLHSLSNNEPKTTYTSSSGQSAPGINSRGHSDVRPGHDTGQVSQTVIDSVEKILAPDPVAGPSSVSSGKSETRDSDDIGADLTIVKIEEAGDTGGLHMFVDMPEDKSSMPAEGEEGENEGGCEDAELEDSADWSREEFSNEGSNISTDHGASWQGDGSFNKGDVDKARIPQLHQCRFCNQMFTDPNSLILHLRIVEKRSFCKMCHICDEVFTNVATMKFHLQKKHCIPQNCPQCNLCGGLFKTNYCLRRHMTVHTQEKDYACPKCGRCFSQRDNMRSHVKRCTKIKETLSF